MPDFGTVQWLEKTHGKLGLRDKLALVAQGVMAKAATRARLKRGEIVRYREVDEILPPDSAIAREAMAFCAEVSEPALLNHCLRAYYWARLLDDGAQRFDDEAVFVALMLHDIGLTQGHRLVGDDEQCFTLVGARVAEEKCRQHRWSDRRTALVTNGITLHLNVIVEEKHGKEAQLVRAGAGADVAALGLDMLEGDQVRAVCLKHPRLDLKSCVAGIFDREVRERPDSRVSFLCNSLGFDRMIQNASCFGD